MGLFDWFTGLFASKEEKKIAARLYVGNLSYKAREVDVKLLFSKYGLVKRASIIKERGSRRSKGYGFVEFGKKSEAQKAMELDGTKFMGRNLNVSQAKPPKERSSRDSSYQPRNRGRSYRGRSRRKTSDRYDD